MKCPKCGRYYHRPQCTEPCEFQSDWTCWKEGSITIENRKCISFKRAGKCGHEEKSEVEKPEKREYDHSTTYDDSEANA